MRVRGKEREWKHIPWHKEEVEKEKRKEEGARLEFRGTAAINLPSSMPPPNQIKENPASESV